VIPWATLGLSETDAWDHRFTYRITPYFADKPAVTSFGSGCTPSPSPAAASFALCSPGVLYVKSTVGGPLIANQVPAVFVSHGRNGFGAYTRQGGAPLPNGSTDEVENSNDNDTFVSHPATSSFDDLVAWISPGILFNKMVNAGKLP
jgi:hypothetical protein